MSTLKDVAKECGLSVTTVSRALNNRGYISSEAHEKIQAAMKKLNYQPNEIARSLSKQSSKSIGVIMPYIDQPFFSRLLNYLELEADKKGYILYVFCSKAYAAKEEEYLEICKRHRVAGIILCTDAVNIDKFACVTVPIISLEREISYAAESIVCDNEAGGKMVAEHLYRQGCRKLLYLNPGHWTGMQSDSRGISFRRQGEQMGMQVKEYCATWEEHKRLDYHKTILEVLEKNPDADGIFCNGDAMVLQAIQVCHRKGIDIPGQVRIVGYDDAQLAELSWPPLTTVHQPIREMAEKAIESVDRLCNGRKIAAKVLLPVTLVIRETA